MDTWGRGFLAYSGGYKNAADIAVAHAGEEGAYPDYLVFPIGFLYRQYLELQLKALISLERTLDGSQSGYPKTHDLTRLWKEFRQNLERIYPEGKDDNQIVEDLMEEFASIDPYSEGFRYPTDSDGNSTLGRLEQVDLQNLKNVMTRIAGLLEGTYDYLDELLQYKIDMESEYGP